MLGKLKAWQLEWQEIAQTRYKDIAEHVQSYLDCEHPRQVHFANRVPCHLYEEVVLEQRDELLAIGALVEWTGPDLPCIVNGLGVVKNHKGKLRIILDCGYLNLFLINTLSMYESLRVSLMQ